MNAEHTADEVAARFRCSARKVRETARRHGIGINLSGRAGWRFTDAEVEALRRALAPTPEPVVRRRRRIA